MTHTFADMVADAERIVTLISKARKSNELEKIWRKDVKAFVTCISSLPEETRSKYGDSLLMLWDAILDAKMMRHMRFACFATDDLDVELIDLDALGARVPDEK